MKLLQRILLLFLLMSPLVAGCDDDDSMGSEKKLGASRLDSDSDNDSDSVAIQNEPVVALVTTTDYMSGAISSIAGDSMDATNQLSVVHSDTVCRYDSTTNKMYLVHRMGSDAVTVLDPDTFEVVSQYSVEAGTNAQDIAVVSAERAYVPRLGSAEILVVNPTTGVEIQRIDLSLYADADGVPEAAQAYFRDGTVFITLNRLNPMWSVEEYSSVILLNAETGAVKKEVQTTATNPSGVLRFNKATQAFVLIETGAYGVLDGGVETLSTNGILSGLLVSEADLGGDVFDAIIATETLGFAVIGVAGESGSKTQLVTFNPKKGTVGDTLVASEGYDLASMELLDGGLLWVADRNMTNPGVRIFDVATLEEVTPSPINVGLPPSRICFND